MGWKTIKGIVTTISVIEIGGRVLTEYAPVSIAPLAGQIERLEIEERRKNRKRWLTEVASMKATDGAIRLASDHLQARSEETHQKSEQ